MSKSGNAPRKPATKFPHLQKQIQKNMQAGKVTQKPRGQMTGRKGVR